MARHAKRTGEQVCWFGSTCYCNSILQALYFCRPFRECVINFPNHPNAPQKSLLSTSPISNGIKKDGSSGGDSKGSGSGESSSSTSSSIEDTLFGTLKELFWKINTQKKKTGVIAPLQFVTKLKQENEAFRSAMHQDAQELLNYILNSVAETVMEQQKQIDEAEQKAREERRLSNKRSLNSSSDTDESGSSVTSSAASNATRTTWVHQLFEGVTTNETKCLTCETVTSKDESFLELSIDIEQNSSVTSCLRQFSASEMLCHKDKFYCDICGGLQEAEKRMKIKKLPNVLALHLKRFNKVPKLVKLSYRVTFPLELRLFNTCDNIENPDRLYELYAICAHIGNGLHHGHYVAIIKSMGQWLLFDDVNVENIEESDIEKYFGEPGIGSGYVLFYQATDLDLASAGLTSAPSVASSASSAELEVSGDASVTDAGMSAANGSAESGEVTTSAAAAASLSMSDAGPTTGAPTAMTAATVTNGSAPTDNASDEQQQRPDRPPPTRETSSTFGEWGGLLGGRRRKDHNTPDRRKSHGDQLETHADDAEQPETKERMGWFGSGRSSRSISLRKDKDREDDDRTENRDGNNAGSEQQEPRQRPTKKKSTSKLESVFERENGAKRVKKAEKEERKREKRERKQAEKEKNKQ